MFKSLNDISKLSIGLYQGPDNDLTDKQLADVITTSIDFGLNYFDVAPNYRNTRSEQVLGKIIQNNQNVFVATKGGFIPFNFSDKSIDENVYINDNYFSKGLFDTNSFDPYYFQSFNTNYLEFELNNSLLRFNKKQVDLYYIHNPEYLLASIGRDKYLEIMEKVFEWLKTKITNTQILNFGISTWDGFFEEDVNKRLQLDDFVTLSKKLRIEENFKVIQFPFNILKTDAFTKKTQLFNNNNISLIRAAYNYNIMCYASAPFGQGKINEIKFPSIINETFYGKNNYQKALSFCFSAPNIKTIILGTSQLKHLQEAKDVLDFDGHSESLFYNLFNS